MTTGCQMNPFPNMPNTTDLGDGRKMVKTTDRGLCYRIYEPDGEVSTIIAVNTSPPPQPTPISDKPFQVRQSSRGQEIMNAQGEIVARTTDEAIARHICFLLIAYRNIQDRKASGA